MQFPTFLTNGFGRRPVVQYTMIQDQEKMDASMDYSQHSVTPNRKRRHLGFFLRTTVELGLLMLLYRSIQHLDACSTRLPNWQNSAVLPSHLRQHPKIPVMFENHEKFIGFSSVADAAWDSLMPNGRGYIHVQNPEEFGLGEGKPVYKREGRAYAVAAFHQLHCLAIIRGTIGLARENKLDFESPGTHNITVGRHINHCLEYMRQAVTCAADPTVENLERHVREDGGIVTSDHGWGNTHLCRDWEGLKEWTQSMRPANSKGIGVDQYFKHLGLTAT